MAIIGYIRVSSNKQSLEHQEFEIKKFAKEQNIQINRWVEEKISSRKALDKRKLGQLLNELQEGDILIACEISRLGRSLLEVMRILESCLNKNCQVWTIKENYRLGNDIQSKVMLLLLDYPLKLKEISYLSAPNHLWKMFAQAVKGLADRLQLNLKNSNSPKTQNGLETY